MYIYIGLANNVPFFPLQDYSSYMFVDEIQGLIEQCGGDVIVTELNSGIFLFN